MNLNPYPHNRLPALAGPAVFVISFFVYLLTASPTVYLGDSGEFIASAFCLGNPHNSGYPLYALAGKMFSLIPIGNVAFRLNLMSAFFGAMTVWLTCRIIMKTTPSFVAAFSAALLLAFSSTLWMQTSCAEVYTFHAFFVALIITILFWWHETRSLNRLLLFSFVVGLSFGNHMQTVMLAPAVLAFIIWSDRKVLFNVRNFLLLGFFFALGLSVYLYLPIRTHAGAAIHWGEPDTLQRFIQHVGASEHRHRYVLTKSWGTYGMRFLDVIREMYLQYNLLWVFAVIGWIKQKGLKEKAFWIFILAFDAIYTIFLNLVPLKITPFQIPSYIAGAILIGGGLSHTLKYRFTSPAMGRIWARCIKPAFLFLPVIPLSMNLYKCDQHRNYTAYEYAANIFRSIPAKATLLVGGDNILFPAAYLRLVENARQDVALYDRHHLFFKLPFLHRGGHGFSGKWKELESLVETQLVKTRENTYMAVFDEKTILPRQFDLIPVGLVFRAVPAENIEEALQQQKPSWPYYMITSFNTSFYRDFMNRSVTGYFFLKMGKELVLAGKKSLGTGPIRKASAIAYDDQVLHRDIATFYTDVRMYDEALTELNICSRISTDPAMLHNAWGYYYSRTGDIHSAIKAFKKSIAADPKDHIAYKNLGLMYMELGRRKEARTAFSKSLSLNPEQPKLINFMKSKGL